VLAFEGLVVVFAAPVAEDLSSLSVGQALGSGGALAVACLVAAGLLRAPGGYAFGWVLQVLVLTTGIWVPMMCIAGEQPLDKLARPSTKIGNQGDGGRA
jgi:hypothetical protein